eukprot:4534376-Alexandrium_andersonii.AAC.1
MGAIDSFTSHTRIRPQCSSTSARDVAAPGTARRRRPAQQLTGCQTRPCPTTQFSHQFMPQLSPVSSASP